MPIWSYILFLRCFVHNFCTTLSQLSGMRLQNYMTIHSRQENNNQAASLPVRKDSGQKPAPYGSLFDSHHMTGTFSSQECCKCFPKIYLPKPRLSAKVQKRSVPAHFGTSSTKRLKRDFLGPLAISPGPEHPAWIGHPLRLKSRYLYQP